MNVYHTPQYQAYRQECAFVFSEEHRSSLPGKTELLSEGYSVRTDYYTGQGRYQLHAARHQLLDSGGQVVYTWDNLDFDGEFCKLISHANGRRYLVFREDLYGYSVLEVETGEDCHYIPAESYPERQEDFRDDGKLLWGCYRKEGSQNAACGGMDSLYGNVYVPDDYREAFGKVIKQFQTYNSPTIEGYVPPETEIAQKCERYMKIYMPFGMNGKSIR